MKGVSLAVVAVALGALALSAAAHGKGASAAEIAGPGLDEPIVMNGTWNEIGRIAEAGGFYAAAFRQEPNPLLAEPPPGDLGPRYTITFFMPGPTGETDELVQDVYPYAKPGPVTFTAGGQRFFGDRETSEGWFVAAPVLESYLVGAGLPESAPAADDSSFPWDVVVPLVAVAGALLVGAGAAVVFRRRPRIA